MGEREKKKKEKKVTRACLLGVNRVKVFQFPNLLNFFLPDLGIGSTGDCTKIFTFLVYRRIFFFIFCIFGLFLVLVSFLSHIVPCHGIGNWVMGFEGLFVQLWV